jgi:hypothetical protein
MELADAAQIQAKFPRWEIVKYLRRKSAVALGYIARIRALNGESTGRKGAQPGCLAGLRA